MDSFWNDILSICDNIDYLDRKLYSKLYTGLYNFIEEGNNQDDLHSIEYYPIIVDNVQKILKIKIDQYTINNLSSFNENLYDYNIFVEKLHHIFIYYNKKITLYNKIYHTKNWTIEKLAYYIWNKEILLCNFEIFQDCRHHYVEFYTAGDLPIN